MTTTSADHSAPWGPASLRPRLLDGEAVLGAFLGLPHPAPIEALAGIGLDVVCIDAEHGAISIETLHSMVRGADVAGIPAVVRTSGISATEIGSALDSGATGVIVPRVNSAAVAAAVVSYSRFPPHGGVRGLGPSRGARHGAAIGEYLASAGEQTLVGVQVETGEAVEDLEGILAVKGLDMVFVGPGDLSVSLDLVGPNHREELRLTITTIVDRIKAAGRIPGIFSPDAEDAVFWLSQGVRFVLLSSDVGFLLAGAQQAIAAAREGMAS